ncbi:MAG: cytochrome c [Planctomycetes bacterium]|nr:cytochrome c [Planctomycetota bacterium]
MRRYLSTTATLLFLLVGLSSCDGCLRGCLNPPQEEDVANEREGAYTSGEEQDRSQEKATDSELKHAMKTSARYMKNLEMAIEVGNWTSARVSAKKLEDLIGQRCVNLYIKTNGSAPEEFVNISHDFNTHVLKLLIAEKYNKYDLATTHFESMKADCEACHQKFKKSEG